MRRPHATVALFLLTLVACDEPTLYIGLHPEEGHEPSRRPIDGFDGEDESDGEDQEAEEPLGDGPDDTNDAVAERPEPDTEPAAVADAGASLAPPTVQQPAPVTGRDGGPPGIGFPNPFADGGLPIGETGVGLTGIGLDWTTWPPRIRFQLSCRFDSDCRRVRQGVCVNSRCVECRSDSECTQAGAMCTEEHICVVR